MINKKNSNVARIKRHQRVRKNISGTAERPRLNVYRSLNHIYAQIIDDTKGITLVSASSMDKDFNAYGGNIEGAKAIARDTRGPIASIYYQGLLRLNDGADAVEKSVVAYGAVQASKLESGCSWITLFIGMAPSLGFLGTVIGMVQAFDDIQAAGDISPTVVAGGMKVALLTTIFGIVVALILQVFFNYILAEIEGLTAKMEDSTISLLDIVAKHCNKK